MDLLGSSAALTPSSVGVASPPECLSGAAADERYRTRSKLETQTTVVDPAEGSEVDDVSQFSHFSAVGRAFGIQAVSSDLASSDKEVASGTCAAACPGAAHMDVTLPAESDGLGSQDNRVASVRCDAGLSESPAPAPHAIRIQDQDDLCPITLVHNCMSVRPHLFGLALPPFSALACSAPIGTMATVSCGQQWKACFSTTTFELPSAFAAGPSGMLFSLRPPTE